LTGGYRLPLRELWDKIRGGQWDLVIAGRMALMTLLLVIIFRPLQGRFIEVITGGKDTPQRMAAYIKAHVPSDAEIETYEPEICFLTGYNCHLPPSWAMDASIKYVWYNAPPPSEYYNFQEYGAPYLLIGDFGRWTHIYMPEAVEQYYELCASIDGYELYRAKTER